MAQQQHHSNQVDDTHNSTGQVIGHMEDLMKWKLRKNQSRHLNDSFSVCHCFFLLFYLLPLVDVTNEAGESEETQQAEDLGKTDDAEGTGGAVHVSGIKP